MRNASGHQCKVQMSGSDKKVNKKTCDISSIKRVTKGLFTWREEDHITRKILEGGITLRWVYMQKFRPVSCPSGEG